MSGIDVGDLLVTMGAGSIVTAAWLWDSGKIQWWWRHGRVVWRERRRRRRTAE
jgi:hypothetical protein